MPTAESNAFRLRPFRTPLPRTLFSPVGRAAESLLALDRCRRIYSGVAEGTRGENFCAGVLATLGIRCEVAENELARVPRTGAAVVVANHPFGAVEGLILIDLLRRMRPDVKVMANRLLTRLPELEDLLIPVDPFGRPGSARVNIAPLRRSLRHLEEGGVLVIFPAGEVSHLNLRRREVADPPWTLTLAGLVRRSGAPVLPVFFPGGNGPLFHAAGLLHPRLRTALLPHELLNKRKMKVTVRIGSLIPFRRVAALGDGEIVAYLRLRTYLLGERGKPAKAPAPPAAGEIIVPSDSERMAREIERLPSEQLLTESGPLQAFCAEAGQIPWILREIGRLREITFRSVGEGTGLSIDIDRFDSHYSHIFLWNRETREIAGAYRLGQTDLLLERFGAQGLYTSTLFHYRLGFLERLGPALELGRSFVRPEYQKSYSPLLLLWKGIGRFVVAHPRYRLLFGPVSISRDYTPLSRQLMAASLGESHTVPEFARLVKARNPLRLRPLKIKGCDPGFTEEILRDFGEVSSLVSDLEPDGKEAPVLLRHYLGLGGKILSFNIDPDFSDVLDGLVLVDLAKADARSLERYLGREGSRSFREFHRDGASLADCA